MKTYRNSRENTHKTTKWMKTQKNLKRMSLYSRLVVVILCFVGFSYSTFEFLKLYWEYPTIVDIQRESPSDLEVPSFTICNPIGLDFHGFCYGIDKNNCMNPKLNRYTSFYLCQNFPELCDGGSVPKDFSAIPYVTAFEEDLTPEVINVIRQPLKEYMNCTLEYAGKVKLCGMETVVSSFYSRDEFPHFCFAIYSLWGKPNKTRTRIPKGSIMKFTFNLNATRRNDNQTKPRHNLPFNPSVLIGIHSPYFLPSPYLEGSIFLGGKAYELRLEMEENTLLPAPYKTNCTDFMKIWRENGGKAPINQMGIVQECRVEEYFRLYECVPRFVDYPHNHTICACGKPEEIGQKDKIKSCDKFQINNKRCIELASDLSQPCQSIKYIVKQEEIDIIKTVRIQEMVTATDMVMTTRSKGHDCSGTNVWTKECSQIDVTILFDKFQITKLTYNPKFEKLELFSVIGGYMGMWLGISLVTIYDKIGDFIGELYSWHKNKKRNKVQEKQSKMYGSNMKPYAKSKDPYHGMW